jgi:HupE / UreJ protein
MRRLFHGFFAALMLTGMAFAHEIPNDVTVQSFFKPEGQKLRVLIRVPLKAMRDMEFPTRGVGYLDLARVEPMLRDAASLWVSDALAIYEDDVALPKPTRVTDFRLSFEADKSFASYEDALAHLTGPKIPADANVVWNQLMFDMLFEYPIRSDQSRFSVRSGLARLGIRTVTVLRYVLPNGAVRAFEFSGDPGLIRLDPRWLQAATRFVQSGFLHILDGTDHLLFLLGLVIPFRRFRTLIPIVTAFTIAHSITLIASAYDLAPSALWFPPLIETLIAASIVYMALENVVGAAAADSEAAGIVKKRWAIAFGFGLVHGFGFSFALRETMQFAGSHLLTSLLSFNVGVELGQILVLLLFVPALEILFRFVVPERIGTMIVSALVAHTGWHWMTERGAQLAQFRFTWPELTSAFLASALRWLMLAVAVAGVYWFVNDVLRRRGAGGSSQQDDSSVLPSVNAASERS